MEGLRSSSLERDRLLFFYYQLLTAAGGGYGAETAHTHTKLTGREGGGVSKAA